MATQPKESNTSIFSYVIMNDISLSQNEPMTIPSMEKGRHINDTQSHLVPSSPHIYGKEGFEGLSMQQNCSLTHQFQYFVHRGSRSNIWHLHHKYTVDSLTDSKIYVICLCTFKTIVGQYIMSKRYFDILKTRRIVLT